MELQFQKVNENEWVAEFQATADFNLHIERVSSGSITVAQRGTESGEYDTAWVKGVYEGQRVIDYDFGALVYPKWIKVTSSSEVVNCVVNFSAGGGSGTGGGSGEGGESSSVRYFNVTPIVQMGDIGVRTLKVFSGMLAVKAVSELRTSIAPMVAINENYYDEITSIAVLDNFVGFIEDTNNVNSSTLIETMLQQGLATEITKEEFYAI